MYFTENNNTGSHNFDLKIMNLIVNFIKLNFLLTNLYSVNISQYSENE